MAAVVVGTPSFVRERNKDVRVPRKDNGELAIYRLLSKGGYRPEYEPYFYPLNFGADGACSCGFTPDFWIPPIEGRRPRPEFHVEVTWLDRRSNPTACEAEHLEKKWWKIHETERLYGIKTVLVTHELCRLLARRPRELERLIGRVVAI